MLGALLVPWFAGLARPFDAAFGWTLMLAAFASTANWYRTIGRVDWVTHFATTGAVAATLMRQIGPRPV